MGNSVSSDVEQTIFRLCIPGHVALGYLLLPVLQADHGPNFNFGFWHLELQSRFCSRLLSEGHALPSPPGLLKMARLRTFTGIKISTNKYKDTIYRYLESH